MRMGFIAILGVLSSYSPPACQKPNEDFMGEDAGGSGSAEDTSDDGVSTSTGSTSADATTTDASASATASGDTSGETTTDPTSGEASTGGTSGSETTGSDDGPCPAPEELCGDTCVDTTSDIDNCGMCGFKCHPVMEVCQGSRCVPA